MEKLNDVAVKEFNITGRAMEGLDLVRGLSLEGIYNDYFVSNRKSELPLPSVEELLKLMNRMPNVDPEEDKEFLLKIISQYGKQEDKKRIFDKYNSFLKSEERFKLSVGEAIEAGFCGDCFLRVVNLGDIGLECEPLGIRIRISNKDDVKAICNKIGYKTISMEQIESLVTNGNISFSNDVKVNFIESLVSTGKLTGSEKEKDTLAKILQSVDSDETKLEILETYQKQVECCVNKSKDDLCLSIAQAREAGFKKQSDELKKAIGVKEWDGACRFALSQNIGSEDTKLAAALGGIQYKVEDIDYVLSRGDQQQLAKETKLSILKKSSDLDFNNYRKSLITKNEFGGQITLTGADAYELFENVRKSLNIKEENDMLGNINLFKKKVKEEDRSVGAILGCFKHRDLLDSANYAIELFNSIPEHKRTFKDAKLLFDLEDCFELNDDNVFLKGCDNKLKILELLPAGEITSENICLLFGKKNLNDIDIETRIKIANSLIRKRENSEVYIKAAEPIKLFEDMFGGKGLPDLYHESKRADATVAFMASIITAAYDCYIVKEVLKQGIEISLKSVEAAKPLIPIALIALISLGFLATFVYKAITSREQKSIDGFTNNKGRKPDNLLEDHEIASRKCDMQFIKSNYDNAVNAQKKKSRVRG